MSTTYTLADFQKLAKTDLERAVISTWQAKSPLMDLMTWKQKKALEITTLRVKAGNADLAWRNFDDAFSAWKMETEPVKERPFFIGNKVDIPRAIVEADTITDQRALQEKGLAEALARTFNYGLIKGNPETDSKSLIGLRYRLEKSLSSDQTVLAAGLDVSTDTATASWQSKLFDVIDDLLSRVDGGEADALVMNRTMKMRLQSAMRTAGLKPSNEDKTGKVWDMYGNAKIVDAGFKSDDSTMVIGNVENVNGNTLTGGASTTILALKLGEPYLAGFYEYAMTVKDVGLLEDQITYRTVIDWSPGIYHVHPRAIARACGIIAA